MPEYDAFGREVGENTLAGLGGADAAPAPEPAITAPRRPSFEARAAAVPVVRVRRRLGCLVGLVVLAAVAAPIVAVVSIVGSDTIDELGDALDSEPAVPTAPPSGIAGDSMIARANFGRALDRLDGMGRVAFIRLSPDRVDAQLVRGARRRKAQVSLDGKLTRRQATAGGPQGDAIAPARIDRSAPARLVRGSAARFRVRERGIDYLVLMPWPGEGHRWVAYFKNGVYVQGDRSGKVVRRISSP